MKQSCQKLEILKFLDIFVTPLFMVNFTPKFSYIYGGIIMFLLLFFLAAR